MKFCLAMMCQEELPWLKLHLPPMLKSASIDGMVFLDGVNGFDTETTSYLRGLGASVWYNPFLWHFGKQAQLLVDLAEKEGYDAILRLDPDEVMFVEDIDKVRRKLEQGKDDLFMLPRIQFIRDRLHWNPDFEPFGQWRAWHLNRGIRYHDVKVHENPAILPSMTTSQIDYAPIFHYGHIKDPYERFWRGQAYWNLMQNLPLPEWKPEWKSFPPFIKFQGKQPLDPEEIGYRAPLQPLPMNYHIDNNLAGDRTVEYDFCNRWIFTGKGNALDFGSGGVDIIVKRLAEAGWYTVDFDQMDSPGVVSNKRVTMDILNIPQGQKLDLEYDLIVCCSAIEHVGLPGRYGSVQDDPEGDFKAMKTLQASMSENGVMILTLPIGVGRNHAPMHRVYGEERFNKLIEGFVITHSEGYIKDRFRNWIQVGISRAFLHPSLSTSETDWQGCHYSLGCFILRKI